MDQKIAKILNRAPQTINNEVKRGTIIQMKRQKQGRKIYDYYYHIYDADAGQTAYEKHRLNCGRRPKWADLDTFIE